VLAEGDTAKEKEKTGADGTRRFKESKTNKTKQNKTQKIRDHG
jgi:hypothetical protein